MKLIQGLFLVAALLLPATGFSHENHWGNRWSNHNHYPNYGSSHYYDDYYGYNHDYYRDERRGHKHKKKKHHKRKQVHSGWDIPAKIAKHAPNCHRYTLSAKGGKGSARITSIPGRNYIQVKGRRSGYVCFQGDPTLELGKLGDPGIKVVFKLEGRGKYGFYRGQTGSSYKNHWYRSYWDL